MDGLSLGLVGLMVVVVLGGIIAYVLLMVFFPEWVGITGKVAKEAERSHRGDDALDEEKKPETTEPP